MSHIVRKNNSLRLLSLGKTFEVRHSVQHENIYGCYGNKILPQIAMLTITMAEIDDVRGMQEILYRTWLSTYPNVEVGVTVEDVEKLFRVRLTEEAIEIRKQRLLQGRTAGEYFFVAREGGVIIGMCCVNVCKSFNELRAMYVLPEHQRKGAGRALWNKAVNYLDATKTTIVHVAVYNEKAQGFYRNIGFTDTGKRFFDKMFCMPITGTCIPEMKMVCKIH